MTQVECPFCSNPNFLADASRGRLSKMSIFWPRYRLQEKFWKRRLLDRQGAPLSVWMEQRGDNLRIVLENDKFEERWRDFTVEVFGINTIGDRLREDPPGPFFFITTPSVFNGDEYEHHYLHFFACRITHKHTTAQLTVHWWPSHGRLFTMGGPLVSQEPNNDIEAFKTAFDFFQRETRGTPQITKARLSQAIHTLGPTANQTEIARELGVTDRALRAWANKNLGLRNWRDVVEQLQV